jgi:HD-like signal output (HDOD) protein
MASPSDAELAEATGLDDALERPPSDELALATLERVSDRIQRHPDFPALQSTVGTVRRLARDERSHLRSMVDAVLLDPALSKRLMRLCNAAIYRTATEMGISSPQRAIAVLGTESLERLAVSMKLLDKLPHDEAGLLLRQDFLRALLAGRMAGDLCRDPGRRAQAHLVGQFQNLGRMVAAHHLREDALAIHRAVPAGLWTRRPAEALAARRRLGLDYADLGLHVARGWGWPEGLRRAMRGGDWPAHAPQDADRALGWLGCTANDLADLMLGVPPDQWPQGCAALAERSEPVTGIGTLMLREALAQAREGLDELGRLAGVPVAKLAPWLHGAPAAGRAAAVMTGAAGASVPRTPDRGKASRAPAADASAAAPRARHPGRPVAPAAALRVPTDFVPLSLDSAPAPLPPPPPPAPAWVLELPDAALTDLGELAAAAAPPGPAPATDFAPPDLGGSALLAHEARSLSADLLEPAGRREVPRRALRALWRGLHARRAVLFLPPPGAPALVAGEPGATWVARRVAGEALPAAHRWRVDPWRQRDLFSRLSALGRDSLVNDAGRADLQRHLSDAWREASGARRFLVLPLMVAGQPRGMIYVDRDDGQPLLVTAEESKLVALLRSQVALSLG